MVERILVVGSGGREHAIARALDSKAPVYGCGSQRNPGIQAIAENFHVLDPTEPDEVVQFADSIDATVAVIGPDPVLDAGVADELDNSGVYAFGPKQSDARIETDKAYQRQFMTENGIPGCPTYEIFDDTEAACEFIAAADDDLVVKPAGLTGGKGVRVIGDQVTASEAQEYLRSSDYNQIVVEERLRGEEYTIHGFITNGEVGFSPAIQDHNHAYTGDEGPSTGGMGTYHGASDVLPFMTESEYNDSVEIMKETVEVLDGYKGFLCGQFMVTANGPMLVEFNARFGDPEALNLFPILETSLLDIITAARDERPIPEVSFDCVATVCKYAVPEGYPIDPQPGARVNVNEHSSGQLLSFFGSVEQQEKRTVATTSRAFAYVGVGETIYEAEKIVDEAFQQTSLDGLRVRHDIGKPELVQQRIEHMRELRENLSE